MENNKEIRRSEPQSLKDMYLYCSKVADYMRKNHLDIGCGQGDTTFFLSALRTQSNITGFDTDQSAINTAKKKQNPYSVIFTSNLKEFADKKYDSASALFVYHEATSEIFKTASEFLSSGASFTIVDYDIKDIGLSRFQEIFTTAGELNEVEQLGWKEACLLHTRVGLKQCIESAENHGFKTLKSEKINDKFFFWAGQKV